MMEKTRRPITIFPFKDQRVDQLIHHYSIQVTYFFLSDMRENMYQNTMDSYLGRRRVINNDKRVNNMNASAKVRSAPCIETDLASICDARSR